MFAEKFSGGGGRMSESSSAVASAKPYLVEEPLSSHDISKSLVTSSEMVMSEFEELKINVNYENESSHHDHDHHHHQQQVACHSFPTKSKWQWEHAEYNDLTQSLRPQQEQSRRYSLI